MEFQFGDWLVSPEANIVSNGDAKTQLEPRVMAVLRYLCRHPGAVIPAEEILQACWGSNELGDNPVHKAITQLRRAFGDSSTEPRYIETIRKRGYRAIASVITLASPAPTTWEGGSPFRGLEAFQENHAAIFFGRVQATAQLRELVLTQAAHGYPVALVLGPSGSGKTSLVRAGLLPQLMAGATRSDEPIGLTSTVYLDCADLGSGTLFQALAGALIDADINGEPLFPGASADSLGQRLASDPDAVASELRNRACTRPQVGVFVDRLEAVFRANTGESDRFIGVIDALARSKCLLMLMACRNDFYPEVMAQPVLLALKTRGAHFDVLSPDGADIAQIVRQPALAANLTFEKDEATGASLDDVLCDEARGNHDMLPLLQYTLNELYRQRDEEGRLKFEVYNQLGGIEGAVGVRAEQEVSHLTAAQIAALPHVLSLVVVVSDDQSTVTSRRSPLVMLRTEDEKELVRVMVEARLFVSELSGDVPSFGVAHEALLRQWPRVVDWINQYRDALQLRTRLEAQAIRWADSQRHRDLLLPSGSQVSHAVELVELKDFSLSPLANEFVRSSASRAKLGARIRAGVTTLIAVLAVLAGVLGVAARSAQREAEQKRADAEGLLAFMLGDFADKLRPLGRLELLDDVSNKAFAYLSQPNSTADEKTALQRVKALHLLYELSSARGKRTESTQALQVATQILEEVKRIKPDDRELLRLLSRNALHIGMNHLSHQELSEAAASWEESLEFANRYTATAPDDVEGWLQQSYAHNNLGTIALRKQDFPTAIQHFQTSLKLKRQVQTKKPNDRTLTADMVTNLSWLGESQLKLGNLPEAMKLYREEEQTLRPIHSGNATWTYRLAMTYMRQSNLQQAWGNQAGALDAIQLADGLLQQVVKMDPTNQGWAARKYQSSIREIELQSSDRIPQKSLSELMQLSGQLDELSRGDPKNATLAYLFAKSVLSQTPFLLQLHRQELANRNLDSVVAMLQGRTAGNEKDVVYVSTLSDVLLARAEVNEIVGKGEQARKDCESVISYLAEPSKDTHDFTLLALQVRAYTCLGRYEEVRPQLSALEHMGFKDPKYLQYISNHQRKKGMQ